jgi:predicted DNA-binding protein (MmcQ/YjbR family)
MNIETLQDICNKFPGVTEDIKWENHLCFCVAEKMFLVLGLDEKPTTASFKVGDEEFDEISSREGFKPAPYMARNKWVFVDDISRMNKKEWQQRAKNAYELIKSKLPKKTQAALVSAHPKGD